MHIKEAKVPGNESSTERKFYRTFVPGAKRPGSERASERKFQGARRPGSEKAKQRKFQEANWPGSYWPGRLPHWTTTKSTPICFPSMQKGLGIRLEWRSDSVVFRYWPIRSGERIGPGTKRLCTINNTGQYARCYFPSTGTDKIARVGLFSVPTV